MITVASPIVGKGGTVAEALAFLGDYDGTDAEYVEELFRLCNLVGFDFRILFAQFCHETANATSGVWASRLNPAGIGWTGDPQQNAASPFFKDGTDAARAHVAHMIAYTGHSGDWPSSEIDVPSEHDPRWDAVEEAGFFGAVGKLGDLGNGKWAADPDYAPQIAAKANAIFKEETRMAVYPVVGLPGPGIELPVPLSHDIIPLSQSNQRPGIKRQTPGYWVQHETANTSPGADAAMHDRWLHNGADGAQLSFHFCVDDGAIYQMIPVDEVTWQAADGSGPGNMSGISCELCVNAGIDTAKARHNAEALAGGIMKALGMGVDRCKRHYDFNAADPNRHHCPDEMMSEGYWDTFVANVGKIIAGGKATPEPFPITWIPGAVGPQTIGDAKALALLGQVTAKRNVPLRQGADSKSPVVHSLKQGEKARIVGTFRNKTGRRWSFIEYQDGKIGRALMSAFDPQFPTL